MYANGEKGICPKTASTYTFQLKAVLENEFALPVDRMWPDFKYIPNKWKHNIAGECLYQRKAATYFSMNDLRRYLNALEVIAADSDTTPADQYYATMAQALLSIVITQAGCRMIEILQSRPQLVYFGQVADQRIGVAISSKGTKTDQGNQHSSPISFIELQDKSICPLERWSMWLRYQGWTYDGNQINANGSKFLFPAYANNQKSVNTNYFTKKVSIPK